MHCMAYGGNNFGELFVFLQITQILKLEYIWLVVRFGAFLLNVVNTVIFWHISNNRFIGMSQVQEDKTSLFCSFDSVFDSI